MTRKLSFSKRGRRAAVAGLFLGALWLSLAGRTARSADSAPDWLAAANHTDVGVFGTGSAAVVLGSWTDFTVDATGKFVMTERRAVRVLNRRAAEPYLVAEGEENSDTKVTSIRTWTVAPSGRVTPTSKKDLITAAGFSAFEEFTDVRKKLISPPGADDGSLIGTEVITEGHLSIGGEKFEMEEEIPVRLA